MNAAGQRRCSSGCWSASTAKWPGLIAGRFTNDCCPGLLGQDDAPPYRDVAAELGLTEGAVKAAAHRLRALYRRRVREEVARTVADPAEIDAECESLLAVLAS